MKDNSNIIRFLLTFFLGWIGSIIINHSGLKPDGFTSRTGGYVFLTIITFGIYGLVASICNLFFDPSKPKQIGYKRDAGAAAPVAPATAPVTEEANSEDKTEA